MPVTFTTEQVLQATGARPRAGAPSRSFEGVSTDTRQLPRGCLFVALRGERFDAHDFLAQAAEGGAGGVVIEQGRTLPGLPEGLPVFEVPDTLAALGALAHHFRMRFRIPVGCVGGSNGKTTTKEMVGAILAVRGPALKTEGNLNNEVGVPLTLFRLAPEHVAAVVEVGMNRPGEITRLTRVARPDAGLITVVQPEHLEGLGSLEGVAQAEGELFRELAPGATAVVNLDDALVARQAEGLACKRLTFGRDARADVRLVGVEALGREGMRLRVAAQGREWPVRLHFVGAHNATNACGAFALALALGYTPEECARGLEQARPYARRLNILDAPGGVVVVDDCYNANPASMDAALDTLATLVPPGGRALAVLGDMLELGPGELEEHGALGARAGAAGLAALALFGPRSAHGHAKAAGPLGARAAHFTEVEPLVQWLRPQLRAGDVVLVKASRGMRLERVVAALTGQQAQPPHGGAH